MSLPFPGATNRDEKETGRVEAFSDGVFAIAITLLILEIRVPEVHEDVTNAHLLWELLWLWPSFLAFLGSFSAILIMWVNHHGLFRLVRRVDTRFLFTNGLLLLLVTFVPFPTAFLARYLNQEGANTAAALYCGTFVIISLAYLLLFYSAAYNRRLIAEHVPDRRLAKIRRAYLAGLPIYVVATAISFWSAAVGLAICLSLWILWARLSYVPAEAA
jgi:uncharacterized membrane protein